MMKTYSSVKEALRSGIIVIADDKEGSNSTSTFRRRHTVDGPSHSHQTFISSTTIRLNPDNAPTETLDVSQYTQEDLKRLKEEDPFFYYSIPEIHLRSYRMDSLEEEELVDEESSVVEEGGIEESQDDESNNKGYEETRTIKQTQQQQGNMTNMNPSPQEKRPRSLSTITHQQTTQGRRATLPPNFLQQSAAAAASAEHHSALQMPIHQGPVTRSRRVSVEAHPYLILESMLSEDEEDDDDLYQFGLLNDVSLNDDDEDSDEEEDVLLRILSANLMLGERKEEEKEEE
eukprot:scaffold2258_cov84-Skeletonema_dohrnii-CCMP3373.AAC.5